MPPSSGHASLWSKMSQCQDLVWIAGDQTNWDPPALLKLSVRKVNVIYIFLVTVA